ncbi:liver-expressed antimicrobial peptide 2 [Thunnus albacares]|uniref:liver-expressed antimicrobial peptide 2 n=1 Tax=Thunnus albacares TaxID=8236 RepID=UPI001CF70ACC|nr:liver-expressed antimicrobial peptide 2 [Thunnus albacares]
MQEKVFFTQRKAAVALCLVLLMLAQQVCAGPLASRVQSSSDRSADSRGEHTVVHTLRRIARMTPLWRIMNSKPFGAYCRNNYECSTGLCRAGHCSTNHRSLSEAVNY